MSMTMGRTRSELLPHLSSVRGDLVSAMWGGRALRVRHTQVIDQGSHAERAPSPSVICERRHGVGNVGRARAPRAAYTSHGPAVARGACSLPICHLRAETWCRQCGEGARSACGTHKSWTRGRTRSVLPPHLSSAS